MNLEVQSMQGTAVVVLKGDVDLQSSPKVRKSLLQCLSERKDVLVDMAGVSYIDSSGIASLVEAFQGARKAGTRFGLVGVSASAMRVLQLARLDRVFAIHPSLEDALKGA